MNKPTIREIAKGINRGFKGRLRFISGKWFYDGVESKFEIDNLYRFFDRNESKYDLNHWFDLISSREKFKEFCDIYIKLYGESGDWLESELISEAKKINDCQLKPLAFPMNEKQLMIINYLLRHDEEKCIILTGIGGSGKSTFGNIICQIFGDVAHVSLSNLSNPFSLEAAVKHRLIYSDELDSEQLSNGVLKMLFSNQCIQVQAKGQDPYETKCQSAFLFCCNNPPRIDITDTGLLRRIMYYSMNEKIKNPDKTLNSKKYEREDLINFVAHALRTDMTNFENAFRDESRYNLLKNNSVYILRKLNTYTLYKSACEAKGLKAYSEPNWYNIKCLMLEWRGDCINNPVENE